MLVRYGYAGRVRVLTVPRGSSVARPVRTRALGWGRLPAQGLSRSSLQRVIPMAPSTAAWAKVHLQVPLEGNEPSTSDADGVRARRYYLTG